MFPPSMGPESASIVHVMRIGILARDIGIMARGEIVTTLLKYLRLPCRKRHRVHSQVRNWAAQFTPEASGRGSIGNFPAGDLPPRRANK